MFAMNWGMDYWVSYFFYSLASPQTKSNSMKKYRSQMTDLMSHEQMAITYNSLGALPPNKLLLLGRIRWYPGFNRWPLPLLRTRRVKKLMDFFKIRNYLCNVFQCFTLKNLYCAIMFGFHRSGHIFTMFIIQANWPKLQIKGVLEKQFCYNIQV